jgi:hypothetical protein
MTPPGSTREELEEPDRLQRERDERRRRQGAGDGWFARASLEEGDDVSPRFHSSNSLLNAGVSDTAECG